MNYLKALKKFKDDNEKIKKFVRCFCEEDWQGGQIDKLSAVFESSTNIEHLLVCAGSSSYILVSPKEYYKASVLGAHYATTHQLNNILLVTPTSEKSSNLEGVIENARGKGFLSDKMMDAIKAHEVIEPF